MKVKVFASDLTQGMYVSELDRPWLETPFLFQGFVIRTTEELNQIRELCSYVFVDVEKSTGDIARKLLNSQSWASKSAAKTNRVSSEAVKNNSRQDAIGMTAEELERQEFYDELRRARKHYDDTHFYIEQALEDVRLGRAVDTKAARKLVGELAESIVRNYNALVWLTNLKRRDEYTTTHCINVCILTLSFGRCLGLSRGMLNSAGLGALLHDLGKMLVPSEVLNKPGKLTRDEFEVMKGHPLHGYDLLKNEEHLNEEVLKIVRSHHERINGGGYPDGLTDKQIGKLTRMVSIVDVYDAVTSDRVYHDGMPPHEALKVMYNWAANNFDQKLMEAFIRCVGIYPIGSLVELTSGHVGVVVRTDTKSRLRPVVILILDADKQPYETRKFINLASSAWQAQADAPEILRILAKGSYGINSRAIIEQECNSLGLPQIEI
jgi:HD-GYP domain-containing protein (c-di-GMP phosphodiesterase class II)